MIRSGWLDLVHIHRCACDFATFQGRGQIALLTSAPRAALMIITPSFI
jgi:hypothetical protein